MYADTSIWGAGAFTSLFSPQIYDLPEACVAFMYFSTKLDQLQAWLHTEGNPDPISIANFSAPFNGWSGARYGILLFDYAFLYLSIYSFTYLCVDQFVYLLISLIIRTFLLFFEILFK